jgi:hypothetical protein
MWASRTALPILLLAIGVPAVLNAQDPPPLASDASGAITAQIDVERALLVEDLNRYDRLAQKRDLATNRVVELHRSLDSAVRAGVAASPEQVDALLQQLAEAEAERAELLRQEQLLVREIRDRRREIALFLEQLERFEETEGRRGETGALTGTWDVVLLPVEQRGVFSLRQSGTLVSGTYQLDGGWSGSLQGTLVNRKLFLMRIDSKLGRMMELEGILATEGNQIRGTWLNYELAGSEGATGQWSATQREAER